MIRLAAEHFLMDDPVPRTGGDARPGTDYGQAVRPYEQARREGDLEWFGWFFDQGFMSWETAERQHGRLRVEIVEAAITIMVAQAVV